MTIKLVKRKLERVIATALALVVVFGIGAMPAMALPVMEYDVYAIDEAVQVGSNVAAQVAAQYEAQRRIMEQRPNRASAGRDILTNTLRGAASMQGFEGAYTLDDPYGIIEIVVQFVTPPAVALRLLNEDSGVRGRTLQSYEQQALTAHTAFLSQLEGLTPDTPPGVMTSARVNFEIFSEHHSLFNGVFMRVPQYMVRQIATLPEVFAVMPNQRFYATPGGEIYGTINQDAEYEAYQILIYIETYYDETEEYEEDSYGPYTEDEYTYYYYDDELTAAYGMVMGLVPVPEHPDFMYESRKLFDIYYIHNNMGITGNGVRVAVLDTGIDHYHTEFERFLYAGLIRGQDFTGSPYGLMDIHGHGTHVAGTVIAMAPNVELWHYKVLGDEGWGYWDWMIAALEQAREDDIHIVNLSLGGDPGSFTIMDQAVNLLVSDGVVAVVSAGNSGSGLFTVTPPSLAGLAITVANGTAGGQMQDHFGDTVSWDSSRGPMMETFHIKPDITAPGTAIFSALPSNSYAAWSGTSMAAPHIAGIAALLLEQMLEQNPNATPIEVKARMMNTARPLANLNPQSVFSVGAGFVRPLEALQNQSFATARHEIPWENHNRMEYMASLSFGPVYGSGSLITSSTMPITIHNPGGGTWTHAVQFNGNHTGVSLEVASGSGSSFTARMVFTSNATHGFYEGNLIFENVDDGQRITMPFAVNYIGIPVDITGSFTDPIFREIVRETINRPFPRPIFRHHVDSIQHLRVLHHDVKSLAGIEHFTGLEDLVVINTQLATLDLSRNTALIWLDAWNNRLSSLDLSNNRALEWLVAYDNELTNVILHPTAPFGQIDVSFNNLINTNAIINGARFRWDEVINDYCTKCCGNITLTPFRFSPQRPRAEPPPPPPPPEQPQGQP